MRIQILSDLHLESLPRTCSGGGDIPPLAPGAEVVVLAGDLAPAKHRAVRLAAEIWKDAAHILYVPGNHEFHGSDIEEARRLLALDCGLYGVTLLDTEAVTVGDVRFIGATLWTDFRLYSRQGRRSGAGTGGVSGLAYAIPGYDPGGEGPQGGRQTVRRLHRPHPGPGVARRRWLADHSGDRAPPCPRPRLH